ncbi:hypothetical protein D3C80_2075010 [compost metagenome]
MTVRNATETTQYLTSGALRAILTDADGAGQERNQFWRGSGDPPALFSGTPAIQPGAAIMVRFIFNPDTPDLQTLTLIDGAERVEFALNGR